LYNFGLNQKNGFKNKVFSIPKVLATIFTGFQIVGWFLLFEKKEKENLSYANQNAAASINDDPETLESADDKKALVEDYLEEVNSLGVK
jgi:hypothetical protein